MKKIILTAIVFILNFFIINCASAENFYIQNYSININVSKSNTAHVSEIIDANFTYPTHGIFKNIPIKQVISKNGEKPYHKNATVSNLHTNTENSAFILNENYVIQLGRPYKKIFGPQKFSIEYDYFMGNDNIKNADEFYFNIIVPQWPVRIEKVNFNIIMPKEFDAEKAILSVTNNGTPIYNPDFIHYEINGRVISGYTTQILPPNFGITIKMELEDKYFSLTYTQSQHILFIVIGLMLIAFGLWAIYGKDKPVVPFINYYPPKNKNSAEAEVECTGQSTIAGTISLIFYLANNGYLEISDDGNEYVITKLQEYNGTNKFENEFMDVLFAVGDGQRVTQQELEESESFAQRCYQIQIKLAKKIRSSIFEKTSCTWPKIFMMIISYLGISLALIYTLGDYTFSVLKSPYAFLVIFPIVAIISVAAIVSEKKLYNIVFATIWGLTFGGIPTCMLINSTQNIQQNAPIILIELVCLFITALCFVNLPKLNRYGIEMKCQLLGFKKYLETADRIGVEELLFENSNYFNEVLPFAYALGVINAWLNNTEGVMYAQPSWYNGDFNKYRLLNLSLSLMKASTPPPPSSTAASSSFSYERTYRRRKY